jgi:hypothetical protein
VKWLFSLKKADTKRYGEIPPHVESNNPKNMQVLFFKRFALKA